jgi:hypothetical protein
MMGSTSRRNAMKTALTKAEAAYIVAMFKEETPAIKGIKDIRQLPLGWVGLFLENYSLERKNNADKSISEKCLSFHKLPLDTTFKSLFCTVKGDKMAAKIEKAQEKYGVTGVQGVIPWRLVPLSKLPKE